MDAVYDWDRFNTLPRAYSWISSIIDDADTMTELARMTIKYGNSGTRRRIGYILRTSDISPRLLSKLKSSLAKTNSLIPLVPNQPERGNINRDWGLIVNADV